MKKLLPKRKPERKPSDEEFALRKSKSAGLIWLLKSRDSKDHVSDVTSDLCRYCSSGGRRSDSESD